MTELDQFAMLRKLRKLRNLMGCDNFSALARQTGSESATLSRIKRGKTGIPPRLTLNAATVMDVSPKKLMGDIGMPEDYFFF